jgi:hypothetical protein
MSGLVVIGTDGCSLEIQCPNRLWMTIRRIDGAVDPKFKHLAEQAITVSEIEILLPDWRALIWSQIPDSDLSSGQWMAENGDWRINIYGEPGSSMWHAEVMDLYGRFMEGDL